MSNTITITAATGEDMQALGERLAKLARGGDVLLLSGPLGAGKTTFAQGFGAGLGIGEPIVSPTFTIARELEGRFADGSPAHLVHVDAYRLGGNAYAPGQDTVGRLLDELESLGLDEELEDPGEHTVILMEWGEQMAAALAPERLEIHIDRPLDAPAVGADGVRAIGVSAIEPFVTSALPAVYAPLAHLNHALTVILRTPSLLCSTLVVQLAIVIVEPSDGNEYCASFEYASAPFSHSSPRQP